MPDFEPHHRLVNVLVDRIYNRPLIESAPRGTYVEAMVTGTLNDEWMMTSTWADWDIQHVEGARVEIKSGAMLQTWTDVRNISAEEQKKRINPQVKITQHKVKDGTQRPDRPDRFRPEDIFVFAWHPIDDPVIADHRLVGQWQFFVVAEQDLPNQDTIVLSRLQKIVTSVEYNNLADAINRIRKSLPSLKKDIYADQPVRSGAGRPKGVS